MIEDEKWLINGLTSGSEEAFEFIFLNYYSRLCAYATGILRDDSTAEDTVQDFFFKLWENRKSVHIEISLKSFLFRSVYNQCINCLEHLKVTRKYSDIALKNQIDFISPLSDQYPIANLISKELEATIKQAIDQLPDQCREVFLMVRYEEMTYLEVAEKLCISINTVKTQLQRAIKKLRDNLKEYLPSVIFLILSFLIE